MPEKIQCPLCPSKMRSDNLLRHITSHRKNIPDWMPQARIDFIKSNKKPILYGLSKIKGQSFAVCLHCYQGVYNVIVDEVNDYNECYNHKNCMACWDEYAPLYDAPVASRRVIPPRPLLPPCPPETPIQNRLTVTDSRPETRNEKCKNCLSDSATETLREWGRLQDDDGSLDDLVVSLTEQETAKAEILNKLDLNRLYEFGRLYAQEFDNYADALDFLFEKARLL